MTSDELRAELDAAGEEARAFAEKYGCYNPEHIDENGEPMCADGLLRRYSELKAMLESVTE
jgi:hypothetical protein